jgi:DNA polymerase-3 subunit gamma/tau
MKHNVLARKWRPKKFADLIGQDSSVTILQNIIASGRLHHAYLLTGTRGVGKTTIARIIAKTINCLHAIDGEACASCTNCLHIDNGRLIDVIEIDAASNTGVDNIREVLENAQYAPTSAKYKVYIIDEVHMLSKSAFNAMLKTLEEPPAHIVFILATTDPQKVPPTILSRCLQLKLRHLGNVEIAQHLQFILEAEQVQFTPAALHSIAIAAQGSMRDALSLTDQAIAYSNSNLSLELIQQMLGISSEQHIWNILSAIHNGDSPQLIKLCHMLQQQGVDFSQVLEQIHYALFQISLTQLSPAVENDSTALGLVGTENQLPPIIQQLASAISLQDCQLYFDISTLGLEQINKVTDKYPIFTMTLLRMLAFTIASSKDKTQFIQTVANNNSIELAATQNLRKEFDWLDFVSTQDYAKLDPSLGAILHQAELISFKDPEINLQIASAFSASLSPERINKIKQLLYAQYTREFRVNFSLSTDLATESLRANKDNHARERQLQAEQAIEQDPIIQDLITNFSAKIVPNSIKALE